MNIVDKIQAVLTSDDLFISYNGEEIHEIDFDGKEIYLAEGDTIEFHEIESCDDEDFCVYKLEKMDFPSDLFELATIIKKMMKEIETSKEKIIIQVNEVPINSLDDLEELTYMDIFEDKLPYIEFYHKIVNKTFLKKL